MNQVSSNQSPVFPPVTSLALHRKTDPEFQTKLSTGFSSVQTWSQFVRIGPLIAMISNLGSKTPHAYTIMWKIQGVDGNTHFMRTIYIRKHYMLPGTLKTIQPYDTRMISPFFNVSSSEYGDNPERLTSLLPPNIPWLDGEVIDVQIDAVIHEDNSSEGKDLNGLRQRYVAIRHAEHDAGVAIRRFLNSNPSATAQQVDTELQTQAGKAIVYPGTDKKALYWHARAQEAQNLRGTLRWHGVEELRSEANLRISYDRDRLCVNT